VSPARVLDDTVNIDVNAEGAGGNAAPVAHSIIEIPLSLRH